MKGGMNRVMPQLNARDLNSKESNEMRDLQDKETTLGQLSELIRNLNE